ncbi:MAG: cation efflux family protein [Phenylobacterium sp.]|jgi:cobalt-zinc-cadmium efflux system protein|uniref:cation diffusion facilitator family transporter n=1 Tax=Phenylobacterium sp. TaxID=1871053 RepID=UPI0026343D0C|nr:cation diffusion facilitator family transporter [Phenylobacterium sp.]MDB5434134.1 cation efflux family protein [Phenylobacterium sp.]MDB5462225.1 cation efflux family protein [Phenylobacterium sp.]MDB5499717.1 cation efflux family protein [Phenylobacterium sp.]
MAHAHHDHAQHDHGAHKHGHSHGHGHHHHAPADMGRAFAIGVGLNTLFVAVEVTAGFWAHSMALLADAGHNLSDVLALMLAWGATILARRAPSGRRTYGLRKGTILASLANAVFLLMAVGAIASESIQRLSSPSVIGTGTVMLTAALGVAINTVTALLFMRGAKADLNARGAFLHMASDAAVSVAVVIGAGVIALTGLEWIDPALSLAIAVFIVFGTWGLLRDSVNLALDGVPREIDAAEVRAWLAALPGVEEIHDLHIWAMSTTETALTAHVIRPAARLENEDDGDSFLHNACEGLALRFNIGHATLQVETDADSACRLAPAGVV